MTQRTFFDERDPLREAFEQFHADNPGVYEWLRNEALAMRASGREFYSISILVEAFRHHVAMTTTDPVFKINNNHRAFYARLLMDREPRLRGFFETRRSVADEDAA